MTMGPAPMTRILRRSVRRGIAQAGDLAAGSRGGYSAERLADLLDQRGAARVVLQVRSAALVEVNAHVGRPPLVLGALDRGELRRHLVGGALQARADARVSDVLELDGAG